MPSELPAELVHHYAAGAERDRLAGASSEELRTQELLARRSHPPPPACST